jgi:rare lipoprotein A (peptidoglycan hydrolase)
VALALVGCGSSRSTTTEQAVVTHHSTTTAAVHTRARPQAIEPVAGQGGQTQSKPSDPPPTVSEPSAATPSPAAPATITRAPAKGAPTDAQVRAAVARFQLAVARYHLNRLNFTDELLNPEQLPPGQWNVSIASFYDLYGNGVACGGILHVSTLGVANKTLPCGTKVIFMYGNRAIEVPVIDRGPYIAGREWDLTGATAEALHFPGLGPIKWRLAR